jgi:hypothetical protein
MGKWVADQVLDGALAVLSGATRMVATGGQPVDFEAAWNGRLAEVTMSAADFVTSAGDASGRKVEVAPKAGVPVFAAGAADHVALVNVAASQLLYVTTCPSQELAEGGSVDFDGWAVEIGDPL